MVWWQYNKNDFTADDGVTFYPAGSFISASVSNRVSDEQAEAVLDGKGRPFPLGQIEGIEFADYNLYSVDLTQNPPVLVLKG